MLREEDNLLDKNNSVINIYGSEQNAEHPSSSKYDFKFELLPKEMFEELTSYLNDRELLLNLRTASTQLNRLVEKTPRGQNARRATDAAPSWWDYCLASHDFRCALLCGVALGSCLIGGGGMGVGIGFAAYYVIDKSNLIQPSHFGIGFGVVFGIFAACCFGCCASHLVEPSLSQFSHFAQGRVKEKKKEMTALREEVGIEKRNGL